MMGQINPNQIKQSYSFIENKGQWDSDVLFLGKSNSLRVWITKKSMVFEQFEVANSNENDRNSLQNKEIKAYAIALEFQKSKNADIEKSKEGKTKMNYFIGNDKSKHKTGVMQYEEIMLKGIYDGIDMRYYFDGGEVRYDYIVQPNADPTQIELEIKGAQENKLENGELVMKTSLKPVVKQGLYAYQKNSASSKQTVNSSFVLTGNKLKLNIGEYDKSKVLVIDPIVIAQYVVYTAENSINILKDIDSYDMHQTIFCGYTNSPQFPATLGYFVGNTSMLIGGQDFAMDVQNWITFFGGGGGDNYANSIISKPEGIYFTGVTSSPSYPLQNEYYSSLEGLYSNVFTYLNNSGDVVNYSTYLGNETYNIELASIGVNNEGTVYLSGSAGTDQGNPFNEVNEILTQTRTTTNTQVGFVMSFTKDPIIPNEFDLSFSSLFGGEDITEIRDIALDTNGNIYATGITKSSDGSFDTTANAYYTLNTLGNKTNFITQLLMGSTNLEIYYNSFFGNLGTDDYEGSKAVLYYDSIIYIGGYTTIDDIPYKNAFDTLFTAPEKEAFLSAFVLNSSGTNDLIYSSYFGGDENSSIWDLDYDYLCNHLIFIGSTNSALHDVYGHIWEDFNGGANSSNIMVGGVHMERIGRFTLEELAYLSDRPDMTGSAVKYSSTPTLIYAGGNSNHTQGYDMMLYSLHKDYCTASRCPCPDIEKLEWFSVRADRSEGTCDSTDCFVTHTMELPNLIANCYSYIEYSSFLDTNSFIEPTIYRLDTFNIASLDLCIKSGLNYTATFRLLTYPGSLEDCTIIKDAFCPVLECPCPDYTEPWFGLFVGIDNEDDCDSNECFISHQLNLSHFNEFCANYIEYTISIDSLVVGSQVKVSLDTFDISSLNRCISIGEKYEISVKIRANPSDSVYCEANGTGLCRERFLEPCYPDLDSSRWEDNLTLPYTLSGCPGCSVNVTFTYRFVPDMQDLQILRIDLLSPDCDLCDIDSIYKWLLIELIAANPMEFDPLRGVVDCVDIDRVSTGGCFGKWLYYIEKGISTWDTLTVWEPCEGITCCWQFLTVCRDVDNSITITPTTHSGDSASLDCTNKTILSPYGNILSCIKSCDWNANLFGYYPFGSTAFKGSIFTDYTKMPNAYGIQVLNTYDYLNFKIRLNQNSSITIKLYDLIGNLISESKYYGKSGENEFLIDIGSFIRGAYLYTIEISGQQITSDKFLVY